MPLSRRLDSQHCDLDELIRAGEMAAARHHRARQPV